ncbi:MAG TPA: HAD family phosphatase, partial [Candidatus Aminicenantes bacterium]|nr:HAD family phosphatase [Candidatus Aminicenantes bacterium]
MLALLERLKKRFRLGLLSNTGPWHAEHQIRASEAFPLFDAVTFSFETGTAKPDRRMFLDIL